MEALTKMSFKQNTKGSCMIMKTYGIRVIERKLINNEKVSTLWMTLQIRNQIILTRTSVWRLQEKKFE